MAKETLLTAENHLRKLLGLSEVMEPTDFYPYHVNNGYITLVGAPSDATEITLDARTLELPEGWCLGYVGTDTFVNSKSLRQVTFPGKFAGIYSNAFRGVESDRLVLVFEGLSPDMTPPALLGGTDQEPFTFGIDMKRVTIRVPAGMEKLYYEAWKDYGVTIEGYIPPETEKMSISDKNTGIVTVSDGNALTQPDNTDDKAENSEEEVGDKEKISEAQEETIQ